MPEENATGHAIPNDVPLAGLFSMIRRMHAIYMNARTPTLDSTPGQFPFILKLSREPGCTQDDLAAYFRIDKGTVARAVRRMEENGLIDRNPDPENRRKYRLFLTAEGRRIVPEVLRADIEWEEALLAGLSAEERHEARTTIRMLAERSHEIARMEEDA